MIDTQAKLRGGSPSELTKLKRHWLKPEFEPYQETWRERFSSGLTQAQIRAMLRDQLQINLLWDRQLTQFRQWVERQDALDAERAAMADDADRILEEFGDQWTLDQVREEILKRSYARALATGDFESGRRTIAQEMNVKKLALDREKMSDGNRSREVKAMAFCLKEARDFPEAPKKFLAGFSTLRQAKQARREAADAARQNEQEEAQEQQQEQQKPKEAK